MNKFQSPYGRIALTDERRRHILQFHPDVRGCFRYFAATLAEPDYVAVSKHDPSVIISYRLLPRQKRYLAIVIKTGSQLFVLTAYLVQKPKNAKL